MDEKTLLTELLKLKFDLGNDACKAYKNSFGHKMYWRSAVKFNHKLNEIIRKYYLKEKL